MLSRWQFGRAALRARLMDPLDLVSILGKSLLGKGMFPGVVTGCVS